MPRVNLGKTSIPLEPTNGRAKRRMQKQELDKQTQALEQETSISTSVCLSDSLLHYLKAFVQHNNTTFDVAVCAAIEAFLELTKGIERQEPFKPRHEWYLKQERRNFNSALSNFKYPMMGVTKIPRKTIPVFKAHIQFSREKSTCTNFMSSVSLLRKFEALCKKHQIDLSDGVSQALEIYLHEFIDNYQKQERKA
ncbi:hypothetical protein [Chroococcidiopsis sp. CCNUC1]|uniref:hypothetical protein n=1 Tax=Chroococcidiopsis sp. CCNUC1 TaxID=2653189 RepID=UPI00202185AD|nr:hypothetical protein [Chroococcidiopsis sp. CCNUC1]URD50740.1 hypothetical protein M5J74_01845 [Chroococcidiopsis sp. CCNUC1]